MTTEHCSKLSTNNALIKLQNMLVNTNIISKTTLAENPEEVYTRDYLYPPPTANELSALTCHQLQERLRDRHTSETGIF